LVVAFVFIRRRPSLRHGLAASVARASIAVRHRPSPKLRVLASIPKSAMLRMGIRVTLHP
jgi:hypothetical protein